MSLNWNVEKIHDHENLCWIEATEDSPALGRVKGGRYLSPVTHVLIFACVGVGFVAITPENADEFFQRLSLWEHGTGPLLSSRQGARYITRDEVFAHIGLSTNAFPNLKAKEFRTKLGAVLVEEAERKARNHAPT